MCATPVRLTICKMNSHTQSRYSEIYSRIASSRYATYHHLSTWRAPHNTYYASVSYKLDHVAALFMIPKGVKAVWFISYPRARHHDDAYGGSEIPTLDRYDIPIARTAFSLSSFPVFFSPLGFSFPAILLSTTDRPYVTYFILEKSMKNDEG